MSSVGVVRALEELARAALLNTTAKEDGGLGSIPDHVETLDGARDLTCRSNFREFGEAEIRDSSRTDRILLHMPWLSRKLSYSEIEQVVYWCRMVDDTESEHVTGLKLKMANISFQKPPPKKVSRVKLTIVRESRIQTLVNKVRHDKRVLRRIEKDIVALKNKVTKGEVVEANTAPPVRVPIMRVRRK